MNKAKPKTSKTRTSGDRMRTYRERMRLAGKRPIQHWVPDFRNPRVLAQIRKEAAMLDKHPDTEAINAWLEAVLDETEWK
jgi:hypothetical protein